MIKKYLLWIWITLLWLIGFSSSWYAQPVWIYKFNSIYDTNYKIWFLKGGAVLTEYLWQWKSTLALDSDTLFWWGTNWQPYFYDPNFQWFFEKYCACSILTWDTSVPENCSCQPITWDYQELFMWFFSKLKNDDYWYYDYVSDSYSSSQGWWDKKWIRVCFSSEEIWNSLCFQSFSCWSNSFYYCDGGWEWSLVNSQELEHVTFWLLPYSWIWYAPWQAWYGGGWNIEWWSNTSDQVVMSWDLLYQKCTNSYVISQIDKEYWHDSFRNWCHAWTFDTWSIIWDYTWIVTYTPWIWVDFKYVYNNTNDWLSRNHWLESNLDTMARYQEWKFWPTNPFMWKPLYLYTYILNLYNNWLPFPWYITNYDVLNYCQLMLYSDLDAEYKWSYFKSYCDDLKYKNDFWSVSTWELGNIDDDEILPPWFDIWWWDTSSSWTVVSADWSWVLSWDTNKNYDWKNFINDLFQKLKTVYQKPVNWLVWIVPSYIIVFLLALILFRFLAH